MTPAVPGRVLRRVHNSALAVVSACIMDAVIVWPVNDATEQLEAELQLSMKQFSLNKSSKHR